ncbi:MAG: hypothetical protein ACYC0T_03515 [Ramlibacter sp.]
MDATPITHWKAAAPDERMLIVADVVRLTSSDEVGLVEHAGA